jgi:hypothetical protein
MQHLFLRSVIQDSEYDDKPWSIILVKLIPNTENNFWFYNDPFNKLFFINMNEIGIMLNLMDNGYMEEVFKENYDDLISEELAPVQFRELCALFTYNSMLLNINPYYINVFDDEDNSFRVMSVDPSCIEPGNWEPEKYARILEFFWRDWNIKFENIYYKDDEKMRTFLRKTDGSFNETFN